VVVVRGSLVESGSDGVACEWQWHLSKKKIKRKMKANNQMAPLIYEIKFLGPS